MATTWQDADREIIERADIRAEYAALGARLIGGPDRNGWTRCHALGREDRNPSASINEGTGPRRGKYHDFASGETLSLFDAIAKYGDSGGDWREVRRRLAERLGIDLPTDPQSGHGIAWDEWNDALAENWLTHKPGIVMRSLLAAGARMGRWPERSGRYSVIALPVLDATGENSGWVMWNRTGGMLPVKRGDSTDMVKMKTLAGTVSGWMGVEGLDELERAEVVWKTEGPTDMMALMGLIPAELRGRHVVICNSGGCGEIPKPDFVAMLAGKTVYVVHDCDKPGQGIFDASESHRVSGARLWCREIARHAAEVRNVVIPYPIEDKHGKDIRDWIADGHSWLELMELVAAANVVSAPDPEPGEDRGDGESESHVDKLAYHRSILATIGLEVLGETESGEVSIFSLHHRKLVKVKDAAKLNYEKLLQLCGVPALSAVTPAKLSTDPNVYTVAQCRESISLIAGYQRLKADTVHGLGCWRGESGSVVLVGSGEGAVLPPGGELTRIRTPRGDGLLLNLSASHSWYDLGMLESHLRLARDEKSWVTDTLLNAQSVFTRWTWGNQEFCPAIVTGLVLASYVQTLWNWRPMVALLGESNTGKSMLCQLLGGGQQDEPGLFGGLAMLSSKSSEAGIRQKLRSDAMVLICDEFEESRERDKILNLLRTSSRGSRMFLGTADQVGSEYGLRHIAWVAATEVGLEKQPDRNRFIMLQLNPPSRDMMGKLTLPSAGWIRDMGSRLLAIAIANIDRARALATSLKSERHPGIDARMVENFAVPAAAISAALGFDSIGAGEMLADMLKIVDLQEQGIGDADDLLHAILASQVQVGGGIRERVSQLVRKILDDKNTIPNDAWQNALEANGVAIARIGRGNPNFGAGAADDIGLFVDHKAARRHLLRGTDWERQSIHQLLRRLPGVVECRREIAGTRPRGVLIPLRSIQDFSSDA